VKKEKRGSYAGVDEKGKLRLRVEVLVTVTVVEIKREQSDDP
jgi:hypothetical protein